MVSLLYMKSSSLPTQSRAAEDIPRNIPQDIPNLKVITALSRMEEEPKPVLVVEQPVSLPSQAKVSYGHNRGLSEPSIQWQVFKRRVRTRI